MNTFEMTDESLQKALDGLEQGKSVEIGGVTYINPATPAPLCEEHYFTDAGMDSEFVQAVQCKNCINGKLIDVREHTLIDGKISSLK